MGQGGKGSRLGGVMDLGCGWVAEVIASPACHAPPHELAPSFPLHPSPTPTHLAGCSGSEGRAGGLAPAAGQAGSSTFTLMAAGATAVALQATTSPSTANLEGRGVPRGVSCCGWFREGAGLHDVIAGEGDQGGAGWLDVPGGG